MKCVIQAREEEIVPVAVDLEESEVSAYLKTFYLGFAQRSGLKPERGLTAKQIVERDLDADKVGRAASEAVVRKATPLVLDRAGIDAVGEPSYGCYGYATEDKPYSFVLRVVAKPRIPLTSYDPVELPEATEDVGEEEVDAFMARVAQFHPDAVVDEDAREVLPDSAVLLGMKTTKEGVSCEALSFEEKEYRLGKGDMPEGFDDQLVGARVGEVREVTFASPEPSTTAGQNGERGPSALRYRSEVEVKAILKLVEPRIDDEWVVTHVAGCATVQEMRSRAKRELQQERRSRQGEYDRYLAASEAAARLSTPIPDAVFEAAYAESLAQLRASLEQRGQTEEAYLRESGMTPDQFKYQLMSQVRERLRQEVALDAVAEHARLSVTKTELKHYLETLAERDGGGVLEELEQHGGMRAAREGALRAKANDWLVEHARRVSA